jgi:predicted nucleic acid-binding protein
MANLFDTNILIDVLRGKPEAMELFRNRGPDAAISVMTVQELVAGAFPREAQAIEKLLNRFHVIDVNSSLARRSGEFMRQFAKSHSLDSNDAVIAATAQIGDYDLVTLNLKHFPMFPDLKRPY